MNREPLLRSHVVPGVSDDSNFFFPFRDARNTMSKRSVRREIRVRSGVRTVLVVGAENVCGRGHIASRGGKRVI